MEQTNKKYKDKKEGMLDVLIRKLSAIQMRDNISAQKVGNFRRLFAYIIDFYAASVMACIPVVYIYSIVHDTTQVSQDLSKLPLSYAYLAGGMAILFYLIYYVVIPLKTNGQTLGKKLLGFRIIRDDGTRVRLSNLLRREVIGVMLVEGYIAASSTYLQQILQLATGVNLAYVYAYGFAFITFVSIVITFGTYYRRMIHDFIGGTKVISVKEEPDTYTSF